MAEYNRPGGAFDRRKEVGENVVLEIAGLDGEIPVSSFSFSEEANTSEVQYTNGFHQNIAVTGVTYSGSFTIPGNANVERDVGWDTPTDGTTLPKHVTNMSVTDGSGRTYTFKNVLINSHSKDVPSDDRTEQSFDFMAEKVTVATA